MPAEQLDRPRLAAGLREAIARDACAVDEGTAGPRPALERMAAEGLLTLGAPGHPGTIADQAEVIAEAAEECLATAFSAWGHRMALEYLAPGGGAPADDLAALRRIGSSAMAAGFKAHVGLAPLPITGRIEGGDVVLDGRLPWASNLYDDAIVVLAADIEGRGPAVVAVPAGTPGLTIRPARDLLALESTASGSLLLDGARLPAEAVRDEPFDAFAARVRRPFLALQVAFCAGLARTALRVAHSNLDGLGAEFAVDAGELEVKLAGVLERLDALADAASAPIAELVRLRLDAAVLVREAVHVEAAVVGGRGYVASSPTARRLREAAFLPVQSPTEAQLRWELRRFA